MTTHYVIVIFPVGYETADVEQFRTTWDPLADKVPAHITLVYPFRTEISANDLKSTVSDVARRHRPFLVELGSPAVHENEYLFLLPHLGGEQIARLHQDLYAAIPDAHLTATFVPHMTIGRSVVPSAIERARLDAIPRRLQVCGYATHISVYRINPDGERAAGFAAPIGTENT